MEMKIQRLYGLLLVKAENEFLGAKQIMIRRVDLHTHTTASDGQYTPFELVERAKENGVQCLAITDHDTVDGFLELSNSCNSNNCVVNGVQIISGVELGAREERHLHILGYCVDTKNPELLSLCRKLRDGRGERMHRIISFLKEKGVDISLEEVMEISGGNVIARPHFAQIMVKRGYVATTREAFDRYLDTEEYQRIERFKASAFDCIKTIRGAGGHPVLAHPYQLKFTDDRLEELLVELKSYGLEGLECYHSIHTDQQVKTCLDMASRHGLQVTAGSDFHGERIKPDISITTRPLDITWITA